MTPLGRREELHRRWAVARRSAGFTGSVLGRRTAALLALATAAVLLLNLGGPTVLRALVVTTAVLVLPGLLLTAPLRLSDPWARVALTPVLGVIPVGSLSLLAAQTGFWHPVGLVTALIGASTSVLLLRGEPRPAPARPVEVRT